MKLHLKAEAKADTERELIQCLRNIIAQILAGRYRSAGGGANDRSNFTIKKLPFKTAAKEPGGIVPKPYKLRFCPSCGASNSPRQRNRDRCWNCGASLVDNP